MAHAWRPSLAVFAAILVVGAHVCADAQVPDFESAPDARAASPRADPAVTDAAIEVLRQQLSSATDGATRYRLQEEMAVTLERAGRVRDALKVRDAMLDDSAIGAGRRSLVASTLAIQYALASGSYASGKSLSRAKELASQTQPSELDELPGEPTYAFLRAESEIARRFDNRHDVALLKSRELAEIAWANFNDASLGAGRRSAARNELLGNVILYTLVLIQNNRRQEALSYALELRERLAARADVRLTMTQQSNLDVAVAVALCSHDAYEPALREVTTAIERYMGSTALEHAFGPNWARRLRLLIALALGRLPEYQADAEAFARARQTNPVVNGITNVEEADSFLLASREQWTAAVSLIEAGTRKSERRQGAESPFVKQTAAMQMLFELQDPTTPVTFARIQRFVSSLASDDSDWGDAIYRGAYDEDGALVFAMNFLLTGEPGATDERRAALAFRIAELLRAGASQGAMADGAARLAANNPKLRALVEEEQRFRFDRNSSRRAFATAGDTIGRMARQKDLDPEAIRKQRDVVAERGKTLKADIAKLGRLRREIAAEFPVYRELISPDIPDAATIGAALRPGEAYVNLYAGTLAGYAFIVQPGGKLSARKLAVTREATRKLVAAVRRGFDAGRPPADRNDAADFDLSASAELYGAWIAPLQDLLTDNKTVYLSASGVLASLPWNVLIDGPAATLASASWWIEKQVPVLMPSASSLVLARKQKAASGSRALIAYADPSFAGNALAPSVDAPTHPVRERAVRQRGAAEPQFDYRQISPLPETLDEVRAIAAAVGASDRDIRRGTEAARSRVLQDDLSDARVLIFATHGVIPGEIPGFRKSGLTLALEGKGAPDSVLTIDDVVGLRLNAEWVVLSACNTGLAAGHGIDSIAELSRGFFAAGARTLLATQWAVESQSAKELTVGTFKTFAANEALSKSDALAQTQRDMIAGKYGELYRHPYFWAAYFISGDAQR